MFSLRFIRTVFLIFAAFCAARADVVVSEIMYNPGSGEVAEEYVELLNIGADVADLSGWKLSGGIDFSFPGSASIPPNERLVVVANASAFSAKYPAVQNYVGDWTGKLSNAADTVRLLNAAGQIVCEVRYSDDGDWAERRRDVADHGHRGWVWKSDADGGGPSLELIQPMMDVSEGQNWAASLFTDGTPGVANTVAAADLPCIIDKVEHSPLVPKSSDSVAISCRVRDDHGVIAAVVLHYRLDGAAVFSTLAMLDDGAHGDGIAGDGVFGTFVPAAPNGARVEFFVSADDSVSERTWPAPARDFDGSPLQSQNCIYQVDNSAYSGAMPIYRIVMRAEDAQELADINANAGVPPFPFGPGEINDQTHSHARFNATFISLDGTGEKVRYLCGTRNRGNGSRTATPPNFNLHFLNDNPWNDRTALVLNSQNTPYQLFGSTLFRKAGLAGPESRAVRLRVNATDPTGGSNTAPTYGFYACNEFPDREFAEHHFPQDRSGNIYRGQRVVTGLTPAGTPLDGASLKKIEPAVGETLSLAELYAINFRKETNESEQDWSDLIGLADALSLGASGPSVDDPITYSPGYVQAVEAAADVRQWMRWLAVNALADNEETNISNGEGDDYYLYFGRADSRAVLLHHDLDTVLGRSAVSNSATHGIFRMCDAPDDSPTPLNAFMKHPEFAPIYYEEMTKLLDGAFLPTNFDNLCEQILAPVVGLSVRTAIKNFNATRHAFVSAQIPKALTVSAVQAFDGSVLSPVNGYPQTIENACNLTGFAPAVATRSVRVNGAPANWSAWEAKWTIAGAALAPGVNRVLVQAFDVADTEIARTWQDVWYFDGDEEVRTGALLGDETWSAANGPYRLAGSVIVPAGATLSIEPGTVIFAMPASELTVANGGAIIAEGTEAMPIRFMPAPGSASWSGIFINGDSISPPTRISHAHIAGNVAEAIDVHGGEIFLESVTFGNPASPYLELENASYVVANCVFPNATTAFEMVSIKGTRVGGFAVFRGCFFGKTIGAFDTIDSVNIQRPGPVLHIVDNVFMGSDDDILDLDFSDAWVEGNIFMNSKRNGTTDSSSAISAGGGASEITATGNIFYRCEHAATATDGNFITLLSNTVLEQGDAADTAVVNFSDGGVAGAGMYLEGNLIHSATALSRNSAASAVTLNGNLIPMPWVGAGTENIQADSLLFAPQQLPVPQAWNYRRVAESIRASVTPLSQSPARNAGPNGTDLGAVRKRGVSLFGAPEGITGSSSAMITVGTLMQGFGIPSGSSAFPLGSGWTHYRWRLDGGAWSAESPIAQTITINGLADGVHVVEVAGKTDGGLWQDDPAFGDGPAQAQWEVQSGYVPPSGESVRIHEVLALNVETLLFNGAAPDLIELQNTKNVAVDISGWGLTDNQSLPFKYAFPPGTIIPAGGFLTVYATDVSTVPAPRTGFSLKRDGDSLTLSRYDGATVLQVDSVKFGRQISDYGIGRAIDGSWALCKPTFGAANVLAERANASSVAINEWLAAASVLSPKDFVELHNLSVYPVDIGGYMLTDNPSDWPDRHIIRPLTFIDAGGYLAFFADDNADDGPLHLPYKLDPLQGEIGFLSPDSELLATVVYGPQRSDISEGLTPNGAGSVAAFNQPTPGGPNPAVAGTVSSTTTNIIPENQAWRFYANATAEPPADAANRSFVMPQYDDALWTPDSQQILHIETAALNNADGFAKTTVLPGINATRPFQTYYFRTHFNYQGPLEGVSLTAKIMCDDGANVYLNGGTPTPVRMNVGAMAYSSRANSSVGDATVQTVNIPATDLVIGDNVIAVSVHQFNLQSSGSPSSDVVWAMKLDVTLTTTFPVVPVTLNEVLVVNTALQNPDGSLAGWAELHNSSNLPIDISGMSFSDDLSEPRKFVFPAGTIIAGDAGHIIHFNPLLPQSAANTGWALSGDGGVLALYHSPANSTALHDSIAFGRQIPNFSVARIPDGIGAWTLCVPSRLGLNSAAAVGQANSVKINEWRSDTGDFFELFNTGSLPVDIGGNFFTDNVAAKTKVPIPPLTFIGGGGASRWQLWLADDTALRGHVNFSLQAGDSLAFYTASGTALDLIPAIGTQAPGQSAGRFSDGSATFLSLSPTPGFANAIPLSDFDGDGIPDIWEQSYGLNPTFAGDALGDLDGDGQTNLAEYLAGTNPQNSGDAFRAELLPFGATGLVIRFVAVAGKTYSVQYKTSLADAQWQKLGDVSEQAVTGIVEVPDTAAASAGKRFYRIVTPAAP